jgi:hypothetical protein
MTNLGGHTGEMFLIQALGIFRVAVAVVGPTLRHCIVSRLLALPPAYRTTLLVGELCTHINS